MKLEFPDLGDTRKKYTVQLDEPEINTIHAFVAFVKGACGQLQADGLPAVPPIFGPYWEHYGATAERLTAMLEQFEDGNAPFQGKGGAE